MQDKLAEGLWRFTASESEMEEWTDASGRLEISQEGSESIREAVDETRLMTFETFRGTNYISSKAETSCAHQAHN